MSPAAAIAARVAAVPSGTIRSGGTPTDARICRVSPGMPVSRTTVVAPSGTRAEMASCNPPKAALYGADPSLTRTRTLTADVCRAGTAAVATSTRDDAATTTVRVERNRDLTIAKAGKISKIGRAHV